MTPQNKAIQLYNMFLNPSGDTYLYGMLEHESAKECAIIAVDEIINSLPPYEYGLEFVAKIQYWLDVKTEILAL